MRISDWSSDVCSSDLDPAAAAADEDALALQARIDGAVHASRPRLARFAISAESPKLQGSASFDVTTRFTSLPRRGVEMATLSPTLWVKPCPGSSRSCTGANSVPRNRANPSGY